MLTILTRSLRESMILLKMALQSSLASSMGGKMLLLQDGQSLYTQNWEVFLNQIYLKCISQLFTFNFQNQKSMRCNPTQINNFSSLSDVEKKQRKQTKVKKFQRRINNFEQNETQSQSHFDNKLKLEKRKRKQQKKEDLTVFKNKKKGKRKSIVKSLPTSSSYSSSVFSRNNQQINLSENPDGTFSFLGNLNGYLKDLKNKKIELKNSKEHRARNLKGKANRENPKNQMFDQSQTIKIQLDDKNDEKLEKKIKKEKSINRNLQKCIIEIQKVLWERTDKLQFLEQQIKKKNRQHRNIINQQLYQNHKESVYRGGNTLPFCKTTDNLKLSAPKFTQKNIYYHQIDNNKTIEDLSKISNYIKQRISADKAEVFSENQNYSDEKIQNQYMADKRDKNPRRKTQTSTRIQQILSKTLLKQQAQEKNRQAKRYK